MMPELKNVTTTSSPSPSKLSSRNNNVQATLFEGSTNGFPEFLGTHFPPMKYAISYGSMTFPREQMSQTVTTISTSPHRMLDFLFVLPDDELIVPDIKSNISFQCSSFTHSLDLSDYSTRIASNWHHANIQKNPSHYPISLKYRLTNPYQLGQFQRKTGNVPVAYFPFIYIPKGTRQTSPVWCKYGVISESDLVDDMKHWRSFLFAGRLHKAFMTFRKSSVSSYEPPPSIEEAVRINRINAIRAALLLLPERFTFGTFLHMIVSLSYMGDIRYKFYLENPSKITQLLHSQAILLSDIYIKLLTLTPGFLSPSLQTSSLALNNVEHKSLNPTSASPGPSSSTSPTPSTNKAMKETLSSPPAWGRGHSIGNSNNTPKNNGPNHHSAYLTSFKPSTTTIPTNRHDNRSTFISIIDLPPEISCSDSPLEIDISFSRIIEEMSRDIYVNNKERIEDSNKGGNRIEPYSEDILSARNAMLSENFMFEQDKSDEAKARLFEQLPSSLKKQALAASSNERFWRLFSPLSLLVAKRHTHVMGRPKEFDEQPIRNGIRRLVAPNTRQLALKGWRTAGFLRSGRYIFHKLTKRLARK